MSASCACICCTPAQYRIIMPWVGLVSHDMTGTMKLNPTNIASRGVHMLRDNLRILDATLRQRDKSLLYSTCGRVNFTPLHHEGKQDPENDSGRSTPAASCHAHVIPNANAPIAPFIASIGNSHENQPR